MSISYSSVIDYDAFTLCIYNIDYISLSGSLHKVRRCSSAIRELILGKEWLHLECLTYLLSISCSSVIDFDTFTLCIYNIDYMSLSDSLQRVRRCSNAMKELDFIKEWLMV